MIVEKVLYSGFNIFEDAVAWLNSENDKRNNNVSFGHRVHNLLNTGKITFQLTNVNALECYFLKLFSGNTVYVNETFTDDNNALFKDFKDEIGELSKLTSMINESDINYKIGYSLYPIGMIEKSVLVTFDGYSLCSVITTQPENFINQLKENNTSLDDGVICNFIKNFNSFMIQKLEKTDIVSDVYFKNKFFDVTHGDICISHINVINSQINFINTMQEKQKEEISAAKNSIKEYKLEGDFVKNDINIFYICNCSFYTFLELASHLPLNCINYTEDFKMLFRPESDDEIVNVPDELSNFNIRIKSRLTTFVNKRMDYEKNNDNILRKYSMILSMKKIKFSLKLSYTDINEYIIPLLDNVKHCLYNIDPESTTMLSDEMTSILNFIIRSSKTTSSIFYSNR